jgi:hypothetical protein
VATTAALAPVDTLAGAESCSEKLLVTFTSTETCLDGSAALCAVSVTLAGCGRICGAL